MSGRRKSPPSPRCGTICAGFRQEICSSPCRVPSRRPTLHCRRRRPRRRRDCPRGRASRVHGAGLCPAESSRMVREPSQGSRLNDELATFTGIVVEVPNARRALARIASNRFGAAEALSLVGVTGTNGKTTTTYSSKASGGRRGARRASSARSPIASRAKAGRRRSRRRRRPTCNASSPRCAPRASRTR